MIMPNSERGAGLSFLVIDSEGPKPLQAKRYQYSSGKGEFMLTGTLDFARLFQTVQSQFAKVP